MDKYNTQTKQMTNMLCTCANEHDVILSVLRLHSVHHQLGELIVHVCPHHDGTASYWVDWVVHGWVAPGKGDDIIRKVLGGVKTSECLAGTLRDGQVSFSTDVKQKHYYVYLAPLKFPLLCCVSVDSQCQGEGMAPSLGKAPTGSWVHLCGRRGPGKLF